MNTNSFVLIILLAILSIGCRPACQYKAYHFDNGDDYFCEGVQRIVDKDGKIGFRDSLGNITIMPQFAFASPFSSGYAKVTYTGHSEPIKPGSEYSHWISDSWYFIDHTGKFFPDLVEITGRIYDKSDGTPLCNAFVKNSESDKTVLSDENGYFRIFANNGDSIRVSYVGLVEKTIQVNADDSTRWVIALDSMPATIEKTLLKTYSTASGISMLVANQENLVSEMDSVVLELFNNTEEVCHTGEWFSLERKQDDGSWIQMPKKKFDSGEFVFNDIGYGVSSHTSECFTVNPELYKMPLSPGKYRFVKRFHLGKYNGTEDDVYVEFEIVK